MNLARNIAQAATMQSLNTLERSADWRISFQARGIQHLMLLASEADNAEPGEGGFYREKARRLVLSLTAQLCRGWAG